MPLRSYSESPIGSSFKVVYNCNNGCSEFFGLVLNGVALKRAVSSYEGLSVIMPALAEIYYIDNTGSSRLKGECLV
jgi:hypothetical protein